VSLPWRLAMPRVLVVAPSPQAAARLAERLAGAPPVLVVELRCPDAQDLKKFRGELAKQSARQNSLKKAGG